MKRKFKIDYPTDHSDPLLAGTKYKPPQDHMVVMSGDGVFFLICGVNDYYPYVKTLSKELSKNFLSMMLGGMIKKFNNVQM
jgi:hypothetical protein